MGATAAPCSDTEVTAVRADNLLRQWWAWEVRGGNAKGLYGNGGEGGDARPGYARGGYGGRGGDGGVIGAAGAGVATPVSAPTSRQPSAATAG